MRSRFYEEIRSYLLERLSDSTTYRGMHLVQHQRLPIEKLEVILDSIYSAVGSASFIEPSNDDPAPTGRSHELGDPRRTPSGNTLSDCADYWNILDNIARAKVPEVGATFNSLKKNTFPNLEGMKLLSRAHPVALGSPKTATLTALALRFINGSQREKVKIFSECNEYVLKDMIDVLDEALERFDVINVHEMMLFLTDITIPVENRLHQVGNYKRLKPLQVIQLHSEMQEYMSRFMGDDIPKVDKLDWHNWWNESKQITAMLNTVVGFSVYGNEQIMKASAAVAVDFNPTRSQNVKREALEWHGLEAIQDWELHHIFPIEYATSSVELSKIDDKRNLIYIPASLHRRIPRTSNLMVSLSFNSNSITLSNPLSEHSLPSLVIEYPKNARVDPSNLEVMVEYNRELLELVTN